jgi:hypothetical protein
MAEEDHRRLADRLDQEADKLERQSSELEDQIGETRTEWRAKQADPGVPGAVEPVPDPDVADEEESVRAQAAPTDDEASGDSPRADDASATEDRPDRRSST